MQNFKLFKLNLESDVVVKLIKIDQNTSEYARNILSRIVNNLPNMLECVIKYQKTS